jgi:hypothetical protein
MERRQELRQHKPPDSPLQPTRNVAQLNSHINLLIRVPEKNYKLCVCPHESNSEAN